MYIIIITSSEFSTTEGTLISAFTGPKHRSGQEGQDQDTVGTSERTSRPVDRQNGQRQHSAHSKVTRGLSIHTVQGE